MSGPKTYYPGLTDEERAWIENNAKQLRELADYKLKLSSFKERIKTVNCGGNISRIKISKSTLDEEMSFTSEKAAYDIALENYARICSVLDIEIADCFAYDESCASELALQMREETERLEAMQIKQAQNQYIYDSSIKVLQEMGYDLIGNESTKKHNGTTVTSTMLALDADTAVNLVSTSDGQYTFEFVGIDHDEAQITEERITELFELMQTKCHIDFVHFGQKLGELGIELKQVNERHPDRSFCRFKRISNKKKGCNKIVVNAREGQSFNGKI